MIYSVKTPPAWPGRPGSANSFHLISLPGPDAVINYREGGHTENFTTLKNNIKEPTISRFSPCLRVRYSLNTFSQELSQDFSFY